jgi:hypothetical protein
MDRDAIRAFVARDRERVAAFKRDHHAERNRVSRGKSGLEAARALREQVRKIRPDWPTARDRDEDFAHHVALKRRIDARRMRSPLGRTEQAESPSGSQDPGCARRRARPKQPAPAVRRVPPSRLPAFIPSRPENVGCMGNALSGEPAGAAAAA